MQFQESVSCSISDSGDDKKLKTIVVTSKLIQSRDLMRPTEVELQRYVICIIHFTHQIQQPILKLRIRIMLLFLCRKQSEYL